MDPVQVVVSEYWLTLVSGVVLPMIVAFVTHRLADGAVKTLTLVLFSVIAGAVAEIVQNDGRFELWSTIGNIVLAFGTAVIAHFGLLKPTNVTGTNGVIQIKVPGGIGRPTVVSDLPKAA